MLLHTGKDSCKILSNISISQAGVTPSGIYNIKAVVIYADGIIYLTTFKLISCILNQTADTVWRILHFVSSNIPEDFCV